MIEIVRHALDKAAKENIACTIEFDNGLFTTSDKYSFPDICEINHANDPDSYNICRRVYDNPLLPFQLIGVLNIDQLDYGTTMELTQFTIKIGVIFLKFKRNIW